MRKIRTHGLTGRGLETEPRWGLNGHEAGNGGHGQGSTYGPPRQSPTLLRPGINRGSSRRGSWPASYAPRWRASFRSWLELVRHGGAVREAGREASGQARGAPAGRGVRARRVPDPRPRARATARRPSGRDACLAVVPSRHAACPRGQARDFRLRLGRQECPCGRHGRRPDPFLQRPAAVPCTSRLGSDLLRQLLVENGDSTAAGRLDGG